MDKDKLQEVLSTNQKIFLECSVFNIVNSQIHVFKPNFKLRSIHFIFRKTFRNLRYLWSENKLNFIKTYQKDLAA